MTIKVGDKITGAQWKTLPVGSIGRYHDYPESYIKTKTGTNYVARSAFGKGTVNYASPIIVVEYINGEIKESHAVGSYLPWSKANQLPLGTIVGSTTYSSNNEPMLVTVDGLARTTKQTMTWPYLKHFDSIGVVVLHLPESK